MAVDIQGLVEEIVFQNEENGYAIAVIETEGAYVYVKGYMPLIQIGQMMRFKGHEVEHPLYGEQISVVSSEVVFPTDVQSIKKYLASGLIIGIGEITADQIVKAFGEKTLEVIESDPQKLTIIRGIGKKKAKDIGKSFQEMKSIQETMIFLQKYGISTNRAMSIYKKYGNETQKNLLNNPYCLVDDIGGIGFKTADQIARCMGLKADEPKRIGPGLVYVLNQFTSQGHTYVEETRLIEKTCEILSVQEDIVASQLTDSVIAGKVIAEKIDEEIHIYLPHLYYAETKVCQKLIEINGHFPKEEVGTLEGRLHDFEFRMGFSLALAQKDAILAAAQKGALIITGGPGTGKTTIINGILDIFESRHMKVLLAAPTGRAAKRMEETTGREAKTIHRLLEYSYFEDSKEGRFLKTKDDPLLCDVLIIDETSMMDISLMSHLLSAVNEKTQVIFVGDVDQLPSVGPGTVLKDMIDSDVLPVIRLTEIFRQSDKGMIPLNAHRINLGQMPFLNKREQDFFFIEETSQKEVAHLVGALVKNRLPMHYNFDPFVDIQVLCPSKRGFAGVEKINENLQNILNPSEKNKPEKKIAGRLFRVGDKVMQTKNEYRLKWTLHEEQGEGIFNGDIGWIENLDEKEKKTKIKFDDGRTAIYDFQQMDMLIHAYAITVHKSQGCEFPVVVMPICMGPKLLMTRNILYTAVTRAKKLVVLVGSKSALSHMVKNNTPSGRLSGLEKRMCSIAKEKYLVEK